MITVRSVEIADLEALKHVRLAALRDSPDAFGSTYAREVAFTDDQWLARITGPSVTFLAFADDSGRAIGVSGGLPLEESVELVSMWVAPEARGTGVSTALVQEVIDWSHDRGVDSVRLWVTETNAVARKFYRRCGFAETGERQPLPSNTALSELQMTTVRHHEIGEKLQHFRAIHGNI